MSFHEASEKVTDDQPTALVPPAENFTPVESEEEEEHARDETFDVVMAK